MFKKGDIVEIKSFDELHAEFGSSEAGVVKVAEEGYFLPEMQYLSGIQLEVKQEGNILFEIDDYAITEAMVKPIDLNLKECSCGNCTCNK